VSGKLAPRWPFAAEAWIDPGSDVFPEYDLRAGVGRVLPWRFGAGVDYRYAQFSDSQFQVVSGTLEYYLPFPAWMTASYYHSMTESDVAGLSGDNDAYAFRYHHEVIRPPVHVGSRAAAKATPISRSTRSAVEANTSRRASGSRGIGWHGGAYRARQRRHGDHDGASVSYYCDDGGRTDAWHLAEVGLVLGSPPRRGHGPGSSAPSRSVGWEQRLASAEAA
jgi:hypothetical protein